MGLLLFGAGPSVCTRIPPAVRTDLGNLDLWNRSAGEYGFSKSPDDAPENQPVDSSSDYRVKGTFN